MDSGQLPLASAAPVYLGHSRLNCFIRNVFWDLFILG